MTLGRGRMERQELRISLPSTDFLHWTPTQTPSLSPSSSSASSNSPGNDNLSDLEKLAVLGHGNDGTVYKVRHRHTAAVYALKVIRLGQDDELKHEAEILKLVNSEFVVRCHGVFDNGLMDAHGGGGGGDLHIIMEYMEAGSLHDVLISGQKLPEEAISSVARRVLKGLSYLHGLQIVHRDIKPSNLLINSRGEIKIADFGVSSVMEPRPEDSNSYAGTYAYMSPERFDSERWNGDYSDGFAGDVWSLGVVVLQCYVGHFPLINPGQKLDWATLMCEICFGETIKMPRTASPEFHSFVWRCLEKDWRLRGTVEELLCHPFVTTTCSTDSYPIEELVCCSYNS